MADATCGKVSFVGAGPGAADLITLRGAERLRQADVVLFDALTDPALRTLAPHALWVDVGKRGFFNAPPTGPGDSQSQTQVDSQPESQPADPATPRSATVGRHDTTQATINALLVRHAQTAQRVVRLKGGDPSVFGRLEEELLALAAAGIAAEVVPGVTAALAAAADTMMPLTRRGTGRSVCLSTAVTDQGQLQAGQHADTQVYYMAGRQLARLGRKLLAAGWPAQTPASVVSRAGWPDSLASQHTVLDLGQAAFFHGGRPTVVTVGAGARRCSVVPVPQFSGCISPDATPAAMQALPAA